MKQRKQGQGLGFNRFIAPNIEVREDLRGVRVPRYRKAVSSKKFISTFTGKLVSGRSLISFVVLAAMCYGQNVSGVSVIEKPPVVHSPIAATTKKSDGWEWILQAVLGPLSGALISLLGVHWKSWSDRRQLIASRKLEQQSNCILDLIQEVDNYCKHLIRFGNCLAYSEELIDGDLINVLTRSSASDLNKAENARSACSGTMIRSRMLLSKDFCKYTEELLNDLDNLFRDLRDFKGAGDLITFVNSRQASFLERARQEYESLGVN